MEANRKKQLDYYPIYVDLRKRSCLVVGTSSLADQKAKAFEAAGALVRRSPRFREEEALDVNLIVADVSESEAQQIANYGLQNRVFVNIIDQTGYCSFITPAILQRGDLLIAISSSGKSPALASWIRRNLERQFGRHYEDVLEVLWHWRSRVKSLLPAYKDRKQFYRRLLDNGLLETARMQGKEEAHKRLEQSLTSVKP